MDKTVHIRTSPDQSCTVHIYYEQVATLHSFLSNQPVKCVVAALTTYEGMTVRRLQRWHSLGGPHSRLLIHSIDTQLKLFELIR